MRPTGPEIQEDDHLLLEHLRLLAEVVDPVPASVLSSARAAFTFAGPTPVKAVRPSQ